MTAPVIATPATPAGAPQGGATPPTPAAQTAPATVRPPDPVRYKLKLRDGDKDVEQDYSPEDLSREIQKARHLEKQRQSFSKEREEFEGRRKALLDNPDAFLEESGFNVDEYLAQRAQRAEAERQMSPDAKEAAKYKAEIQRLQKQQAEAAKAKEVETEQAAHSALVNRNVATLGKAIELSGRPRSGGLLKLYAEVQEMAIRAGEPELSPDQIVTHANRLETQRLSGLAQRAMTDEKWRASNAPLLGELAKAVLPQLQGKALLDFLGPQLVAHVARASLEALRASPTPLVSVPNPVAPVPPANGAQKDRRLSQWDLEDRLMTR